LLPIRYMVFIYAIVVLFLFFYVRHYLKLPILSGPFIYVAYLILNMGLVSLLFYIMQISGNFMSEDAAINFNNLMERSKNWIELPSIKQSILVVILAFCGLGLGLAIAKNRHFNSATFNPRRLNYSNVLYWGGMFGVVVCSFIIFCSKGLFLNYGDQFILMNTTDRRFFMQAVSLVGPLLLFAMGGANRPKQIKLIALMYLIVMVPIYMSGWRGIAFITLISLLIMIKKKEHTKLKYYYNLLVFLSIILVLSSFAIGKLRVRDNVKTGLLESTVFTLMSTSQQIETVSFTVNEVMKGRSLGYGKSYLQALLEVMPNLGSNIDTTPSRSLNSWITGLYYPEYAKQFAGISYSGIAEAYYNFGIIGVLIIFTTIGYFLFFLDHKASTDFRWFSLYGIVFYCLIFGTTKGESILISRTFFLLIVYRYILIMCTIAAHKKSYQK
jgi:oligosaccharide repeat unit polymerase